MKSNVTYARPPLLLTILFLFFSIIFSNSVIAQRQNLIMESTFEGTNPFAGFQYGYQFCCNYSVTQSTTVARAGSNAVKFDLRSTDPVISSSVRAEIEPQTTDQQEMERWYGLSYYLVNYGTDDGAESILQWHDVDGTCPPLSIQVQGGRLRVQQCINNSNTPNDLGPVVSNQWFDIVMHVKWTTTNTGILQVWKDGVLVVNKSNIRTNSSGGSYMKVGINKWSWAPPLVGSSSQTQRVFYIDEFRIGNASATYADVAPSSTTTPPPVNQPPVAHAGNDIILTLPTNSTTLNGNTSTDADGTITSYAWTRVSGPATYSLSNPNSSNTTLSGLVQGTYVFRLTVTDNNGATATDDINVTVNPAPNQLPAANAGNDITLTLPTNTTTLTGSGTDPDGTIASYAWSRVSGPTTYTLSNPNTASTSLSGLVQGTYVFKLTVTDNSGATATDNINVIVNPAPNQLPTANAGNDITLTLPTNTTTLTGSGTDPDGTIASYAWSRVSGPTTYTLSSANTASTSLSGLVQGTYVFKLTVIDNSGGTATDNINVIVNPAPNQLPTVNAGNDITLTLPTNSTTLSGTASDPDGTIASYAWSRVSGPATYTLSNANAATTALTGLVQGTYVFKLTVTDNSGATTADNINVIVNAAPNQPPVARAGSDQTITLPLALVTLDGSASSDPDGTITNYSWSRVSGPTTFSLLSPLSAVSIVNSLVQGTYVFRLTVTDNSGATATDDVTITVNPLVAPNQPPVAHAGNDITLTLPANSTTLNGSATDVDGTISSYAWNMISGPATYTIASPNTATTAISNLVQGTYVFSLTATDNSGATGIDYVTIMVNAVPTSPNQTPAANAGNDITLTLPANSTILNGSGIDPDGSITAYAWSKISGPAAYTLGNPAAASTTLGSLVQGVYVFRLTVTDNGGATASAFVTITVNAAPPPPNQAPTANAGNDITITLPTNATTLSGSGTDPDGTIAGYAWNKISGPATYSLSAPNAAATALNNLVQGVYVFSLTVTDNNGATGIDYVTVIVNAAPPPPNQAPVAHAGNDIMLRLPNNATTLDGSTSTDPDGTITTYAWSRVSGSGPATYAFSNPSAAITGVNSLVAGVYVFRLTVTDNNGASASDDITVTVLPANVPPASHAGNDIVMTLPTNSTTLNGNTSADADGTITGYVWTKVSGPLTYVIVNPATATTTLSNLVQGVYVFRLTVTDNDGAIASDDITVTVNAAVPATNQPPVANAGSNITLMLPEDSVTLYGTNSTDPDGVITAYQWEQTAGPTQVSLSGSYTSTLHVANLMIGDYWFTLKVTDNRDAVSVAQVKVTVKTRSGEGLYCNVFPNPASATLNIEYSGNNNGKMALNVYDVSKHYVFGKTVTKDQVTLKTTIDVSSYQPGTYFLELIIPGSKKVVKKFIKL